jgi:hypothetical protein
MNAGDLGLNPDIVGLQLSRILEIITKWYAILLLDKADVFFGAAEFTRFREEQIDFQLVP